VSEPAVLLLHGFGTSFASTWVGNGWTALLEDAGREVVGVDLLGHGTAPKPHDPDAYRGLEDHVLAALPDGPLDAIGFSYGARTLLVLAARNPGLFKRLVVAGVGARLMEAGGERMAAVVRAVRTGEAEHPQLAYFARLPEAADADREALAAFLERPDRGPLTPEVLAAVDVPVLVVLGDRDDAGPAQPLVDALPDATLVMLPGVDHFATPKDLGFIDAALGFIDAQPF
jgi:pimeloyl-ACP methyl ester carboxylesterase